MFEEVSTTLNAVVTCIGCQLSFILMDVDTHEEFETIISATEDHTVVFIPINTICRACWRRWKSLRKFEYFRNMKINSGDVATTLLGDDVKIYDIIPLAFPEIQKILKEVTEVVELQVEKRGLDLVVTETPHVSGRMLLRIYGTK